MINSSPTFKSVTKDRLFYNRYEYSIGFHLDEVHCLRELNHKDIDDCIERRKSWQEVAQQRWALGSPTHGILVPGRWKTITPETVANLHTLADTLLTATVDFKLVVSSGQGYVYTNDLALITQLDSLAILTSKTYSRAQIVRPKNTIALKNSKYQYRSYFRLEKLTAQEKNRLVDFFSNQQKYMRLSPALIIWLGQPFNRMQDYFFIDYEHEHWLTMLSLVRPGLVRKTMQIIPAK